MCLTKSELHHDGKKEVVFVGKKDQLINRGTSISRFDFDISSKVVCENNNLHKTFITCVEKKLKRKMPDRKQFGKQFCLKCNLCGVLVNKYLRKMHCQKHLKEEAGIGWLYRCLLCAKENPTTTMYRHYIQKHLQRIHRISNPQREKHYYDGTFEYKNIIKAVEEKCFCNLLGFTPVETNTDIPVTNYQQSTLIDSNDVFAGKVKEFERQMFVKCAVCTLSVYIRRTREHCLKHLEKEGGVNWLYRCLLCSRENQMETVYKQSIYNHLQMIHKIN